MERNEQIKTTEELAQALGDMVTDPEYRCMVAVAFYPDGVKLVVHGAANLEMEVGMIQQALGTLAYRMNQVTQVVLSAKMREQRDGTN